MLDLDHDSPPHPQGAREDAGPELEGAWLCAQVRIPYHTPHHAALSARRVVEILRSTRPLPAPQSPLFGPRSATQGCE